MPAWGGQMSTLRQTASKPVWPGLRHTYVIPNVRNIENVQEVPYVFVYSACTHLVSHRSASSTPSALRGADSVVTKIANLCDPETTADVGVALNSYRAPYAAASCRISRS